MMYTEVTYLLLTTAKYNYNLVSIAQWTKVDTWILILGNGIINPQTFSHFSANSFLFKTVCNKIVHRIKFFMVVIVGWIPYLKLNLNNFGQVIGVGDYNTSSEADLHFRCTKKSRLELEHK